MLLNHYLLHLAFTVLATEALVMWTSRFGILKSNDKESGAKKSPEEESFLELEILIGDEGGVDDLVGEEGPPQERVRNYNPYFSKNEYKRKRKNANNRNVLTVYGDGRMTRKQVIR